MRAILAALVCFLSTAVSGAAMAATYHVGKDQTYASMQDLLAKVVPADNDVILVHPGTYPAFKVTTGGGRSPEAAPVIRAYDRSRKPVFDAAGQQNCIEFSHGPGRWYAIEDLEICNASFRGVFNVECGLVMRGCYVHDCRNGFMGGMHNTREETPGYLIAEHNEFARNGSGGYAHQLYVQEYWTVFRYNWIHDNTGGSAYKDRSRQSLVEYNLIEQGPGATYTIEFCGCGDTAPKGYVQSATMVGNVVTKKGGDNRWLFIANIRSEGGRDDALNVGRLSLVNNTFYTEDHTGPMLGTDEGSIITACNNIFDSATSTQLWNQVMSAKGPGKLDASTNNWVRTGMEVPPAFAYTIAGDNPGFVNRAPLGGDFHLLPNSPCIGAGSTGPALPTSLEYRHPCGYTHRAQKDRPDIGAFGR